MTDEEVINLASLCIQYKKLQNHAETLQKALAETIELLELLAFRVRGSDFVADPGSFSRLRAESHRLPPSTLKLLGELEIIDPDIL